MNQERIYILAIAVVALLASIPQIPLEASLWGAVLVIIGLVGGVMVNYPEPVQRVLVYVVAATLATLANSLDFIWVVGPWVNVFLDNIATGIQGMAIGLIIMGLISRVQGEST